MSMVDIDELRRNPDDGAYHCPRCDAPFTRRSNLRRHHAIHLRSATAKCQACGMSFASSEELQRHNLQCPKNVWYTSDSSCSTSGNNLNNTSVLEASSTTTPDFFSLASPFLVRSEPTQQENMDEFLSSFLYASIPPSPLSFTPDGSAPPSGMATPDWGATALPPKASDEQQRNISEMSTPAFQPRSQWTNGINDTGVVRRGGHKEKPIYTRRQVEDMLDIMVRTFEERMEEIMWRSSHSNPREFAAPSEGSVAPGASSMYPATYGLELPQVEGLDRSDLSQIPMRS